MSRTEIVSGVNEEDYTLTSECNSGQPCKSPFPPSPKWINEERRYDEQLHINRQVPRLTHALPENIFLIDE
jgi:hypothetical protein